MERLNNSSCITMTGRKRRSRANKTDGKQVDSNCKQEMLCTADTLLSNCSGDGVCSGQLPVRNQQAAELTFSGSIVSSQTNCC